MSALSNSRPALVSPSARRAPTAVAACLGLLALVTTAAAVATLAPHPAPAAARDAAAVLLTPAAKDRWYLDRAASPAVVLVPMPGIKDRWYEDTGGAPNEEERVLHQIAPGDRWFAE